MSEHAQPSMERHCDVCVVGGSAAGLAAALQLGRQRRAVIVVDDGTPRNAPAAHVHGYLFREGTPPPELAEVGREEVRGYGGEVLTSRVADVRRDPDERFRLALTSGHVIVARRVLIATGLADLLPDIDGLRPQWGRGVIHCPFCHGYEVRDQRVVQLVTHAAGLRPSSLFRQLTDRLVVVHEPSVTDQRLEVLAAAGVDVRVGSARRIVTGPDDRIVAVELTDGSRLDADAVAIGPEFRVRAEAFAPLGLRPTPHPIGHGDMVEVDATGQTTVPGLYAAGNVTDPSQQVIQAAAHGSRVGAMIAFSLADEDLAARARPSANRLDWDRRYSGEQIWSGNPNGSLVQEVRGTPVGRALDVGAGEGGDAIWLAEQGWRVTASDVSTSGLARVGAEAQRRGLTVDTLHADANDRQPFELGAYDLVSAHYASIPRTPDDRAVHNLMDAVAPGGILLVVGHDPVPMRAVTDLAHGRPWDADGYVQAEKVAAVLADAPGWVIEVQEKRVRPGGSATAAHHVADIVLRARRLS